MALLILVTGLFACAKNTTPPADETPTGDTNGNNNGDTNGETNGDTNGGTNGDTNGGTSGGSTVLSYNGFAWTGSIIDISLTINENDEFEIEMSEIWGDYEKHATMVEGKVLSNDTFIETADLSMYESYVNKDALKGITPNRKWLAPEKLTTKWYCFDVEYEVLEQVFISLEAYEYLCLDKIDENMYVILALAYDVTCPLFVGGEKGSQDEVATAWGMGQLDSGIGIDFLWDISEPEEDEKINQELLVFYKDGSIEIVQAESDTIGSYDINTAGIQVVEISYKGETYPGKAWFFDFSAVEDSPVLHCFVDPLYAEKETTEEDFKNSYNEVLQYYDQGNWTYLHLNSDGVEITGYDASETGTGIITIKYEGLEIEVILIVYDPNNLKIEYWGISCERFAKKGEDLDIWSVEVFFDNGEHEDLDLKAVEEIEITGFDKNAAGIQLVTFKSPKYNNQEGFFVVWVYEEENEPLEVVTILDSEGYQVYEHDTVTGELDIDGLVIELSYVGLKTVEIGVTESMVEYTYIWGKKAAVIKYEEGDFLFWSVVDLNFIDE